MCDTIKNRDFLPLLGRSLGIRTANRELLGIVKRFPGIGEWNLDHSLIDDAGVEVCVRVRVCVCVCVCVCECVKETFHNFTEAETAGSACAVPTRLCDGWR
jgi:hypothetical protein